MQSAVLERLSAPVYAAWSDNELAGFAKFTYFFIAVDLKNEIICCTNSFEPKQIVAGHRTRQGVLALEFYLV
jgi:hypothetical protein